MDKIIPIAILVLFIILTASWLFSRYRMCPPDKILIVNLSQLERVFEAGATVDENTLRAAKLVQGPCDAVKLLGNGTLTKSLNVVVDFVSASAREKVTQAGGTVTVLSEA